MSKAVYRRPEVTNHGSLAALTADFDLHFVGGAAKLLTMAAVSAPLTGAGSGLLPSGQEVVSGSPSSASGPLADMVPGSGGSESLTTQPVDGGTLGDTGTSGSGGGSGSGSGGSGGGGKLPFTGFAVMMFAALGAAFAGAGAAVRARLRRST